MSASAHVILSLVNKYDQYGSDSLGGYRYYADYIQPFVRASQVCYVDRLCYENWCALGYVHSVNNVGLCDIIACDSIAV